MEPQRENANLTESASGRKGMSTRRARVLLASCVAFGATAVLVSRTTTAEDIAAPRDLAASAVELPVLEEEAPPVTASGWINTEALDADDLRGRVVLYDFWTFGCINCQRTMPYVQAWHERYEADGLLVLSVHTPEFDYERDPDAVAAFVEENGLTYPVALDPDKVTWRAFGNHYWPHFYLHDIVGRRRYDHIGEGRYAETEDAIRFLLGVDPNSPRASVPG